MKHIYTSLDIGSDSIKIVVCELYQNKLNLLAASSYKSKGIKKGLIVDTELAKQSVKGAISEVENMLGIRIKKVITSVPGYNAGYRIIKGNIKINREEPITHKEVLSALEESVKTNMDITREMVTILPIDYIVDDKAFVKDPIGMHGSNLEARAILVTSPKKTVYSVISLLESIGIEVVDISLNTIGDLYSFNSKKFQDKIGAIINIGSDTTTVSLYNKSILIKDSIINMGGKNIEHDIAYIYKTDLPTAINLKTKFALASTRNANINDVIDIKTTESNNKKVNQFEISEVIASRLEEIFNEAKKEINLLTSQKIDYIIITGGTSNIADIEYILKEIFGEIANIGNIKVLGIRNNKYSSCVGNIVYFLSKLKLKNLDYTMISDDEAYEMTSITTKKLNASDSMLGKIFGYFFSE